MEKYKPGEVREVKLDKKQVTDLIIAGLEAKYPKAELKNIVYNMFQNKWGKDGPVFSATLTLEKL